MTNSKSDDFYFSNIAPYNFGVFVISKINYKNGSRIDL